MADKDEVRTAQFSLLQACLPGRPAANIGVLLVEPGADRLHARFRRDWDAIADPDEVEVLEQLRGDLTARAEAVGAAAMVGELESTLSNAVRISDRAAVEVADFRAELNRLYHEHVQKPEASPFRLPVFSLRAAATKFGGDMEVETEPEAYVEAPEDLRKTDGLFAARVVGKSMEPLIPDGAMCVFRANVTGTRIGKRLLVQRLGASATGGEFTVKQYRSRKTPGDEWEHASIQLQPLNQDFDSLDLSNEQEFRVIGEFVRVLE